MGNHQIIAFLAIVQVANNKVAFAMMNIVCLRVILFSRKFDAS